MGKKDVSPEIKLYIAPSDSYDNTPQGFSFRYLPIPQESGGIDGTSPDAKFKLQISLYGKEAANFDTSQEVSWEPTNKGSASKFAFAPLKSAQIAGGFIQFTTNKFGKYCCAANQCAIQGKVFACTEDTETLFAATSKAQKTLAGLSHTFRFKKAYNMP